jgi:beta-lactamase class A
MKNKSLYIGIVVVAIALTIGFTAGRLSNDNTLNTPTAQVPSPLPQSGTSGEIRAGGYMFINPLLECDNYQPPNLQSITNLNNDVNEYIAEAQMQQKASFISVYFRDLNNGPWLGINEHENYSPASLLKVPVMVAVLKKAETEPQLLNRVILFKGNPDLGVNPNIKDGDGLIKGKSYKVDDLLYKMIAYSDNDAMQLLLDLVSVKMFATVLADLGMNIANKSAADDFISVKDYSSFFRVLYNGTYLNRDMSEKALSLLSKSTFKNGLCAGVPQGTLVAHKFGERAYEEQGIRQLHDCGIVYVGNKPYLLCVMTRGKEFAVLESVIADISRIVYNDVIANPPK